MLHPDDPLRSFLPTLYVVMILTILSLLFSYSFDPFLFYMIAWF